jgi:hypothetical protein
VSKRKRLLVWLGSSVLAVAVYVWFFGVAAMATFQARYVGRKFPVVKMTPTALQDSSMLAGPIQKLTYAGFEFEVPWTVDETKTRQISPTSEVIAFTSGNAIWFSRIPRKDFVHTFRKCSGLDEGGLRQLFGDAVDSDYALHKLILNSTPEKIGLLSGRREAVAGAMLLLYKGMMMSGDAETGIFQVQTNAFRGFQYGDPLRRPKTVDVEMFADDGGLAFLFVQRQSGPVPSITQAEINRVVQSAHAVANIG